MPAWLIPAIGAAAGIFSSVHDSNARIRAQESANKMNMQLSREQMKWNEIMWNKTNAYNDPRAQMARLKAAGLNPHLIYGTSPSSAVGTAGDIKGYDKAEVKSTHEGYRAFSDILGHTMQSIQASNVIAQNDVLKQEAVAKAYQTLNTAVDTDRKAFDLGLSKELRQTSIQAAKANADKAVANADAARTDAQTQKMLQIPVVKRAQVEVDKALAQLKGERLNNRLKELERDLNEQLKPYGLTANDNVIARIIMASPFFENIFNYLKP